MAENQAVLARLPGKVVSAESCYSSSRMRNGFALLLLLCLMPLTGCVSSWIISGGKRYEHLNTSRSTVDRVRGSLGEPEWSVEHSPPLPVCATPEFKSAEHSDCERLSIMSGRACLANGCLTSRCEVYRIRGPLADSDRATTYVMALVLTLGVGEVFDPICMIEAVRWRRGNASNTCWLTYWYDSDGRYVGHMLGDIRRK